MPRLLDDNRSFLSGKDFYCGCLHRRHDHFKIWYVALSSKVGIPETQPINSRENNGEQQSAFNLCLIASSVGHATASARQAFPPSADASAAMSLRHWPDGRPSQGQDKMIDACGDGRGCRLCGIGLNRRRATSCGCGCTGLRTPACCRE
jgi:hypothetical protein